MERLLTFCRAVRKGGGARTSEGERERAGG